MESIRLNKSIEISVNEAGDTIRLYIDDNHFIDKFYGLAEIMEKTADEMKSEEMKQLEDRDIVRAVIDKTKIITDGIDNLFGDDTCKKVFGDISPSPYLLIDFFDQLIPIFEKYTEGRKKQIATKYNPNRKGTKTKEVE